MVIMALEEFTACSQHDAHHLHPPSSWAWAWNFSPATS